MDVSLQRLAFYAGAGVAFFFAIGAATASILAAVLFVAGGLIALPQVRSQLRARGTVITTWLAAALLVTSCIGGLAVYSVASTQESTQTTAGGGTATPSELAVSFSANNTTYQNDVDRLHVAWNAEARETVDPQANDGYSYEGDADHKYIVVRVNITNTGERRIDLTQRYFRLLTDGVEYSPQHLVGGDDLRDVTLRPDASYTTHLTFEVPRNVDSATLIANPEAYNQKRVAAVFYESSNLTVQYSA